MSPRPTRFCQTGGCLWDHVFPFSRQTWKGVLRVEGILLHPPAECRAGELGLRSMRIYVASRDVGAAMPSAVSVSARCCEPDSRGGATPLLGSEVALPLDTSDRTLHPFMVFWAKQSSDVSRCRVHGSRPRLSRTGSVVSVWS